MKLNPEQLELINKIEAAAKRATPDPWESEELDGYITGHIISPNHTYAGNSRSRRDSITDPSCMTRNDSNYISLCQPSNILTLIQIIKEGGV